MADFDFYTIAKFWSKVKVGKATQCWPYMGFRRKGYGRFRLGRECEQAHRVAYAIGKGEPGDLHVLHHCDNRPCCNPRHLYLGTDVENVRDRKERDGIATGERNGRAKLSSDQVIAIRAIPKEVAAAEVGRMFGVAKETIKAIRQGRSWRHLLPVIFAVLCVFPSYAQTISGYATVVDGDTIELAGQRIRLAGIDAPERAQTCEGALGVYQCGRDASATLAAILRGRSVSCEPEERDRYGRTVAVCSTEAGDIGAAMVRQGAAIDYARYSRGRYAAEQAKAKAEGLGIWSGRFEPPEEFRRKHRAGK